MGRNLLGRINEWKNALKKPIPEGALFYPCCGRDTGQPLRMLMDTPVNEYHFVDAMYLPEFQLDRLCVIHDDHLHTKERSVSIPDRPGLGLIGSISLTSRVPQMRELDRIFQTLLSQEEKVMVLPPYLMRQITVCRPCQRTIKIFGQRADRIRSIGLVVLSPSFFSKGWTNYELDGIVTRAVSGDQILCPMRLGCRLYISCVTHWVIPEHMTAKRVNT